MKKIVSLLLGLAILTLTGCPATSDKAGSTWKPGTQAMGTPATKSKEVLDRIAGYKEKWGVTPEKNAQYKPKILITLKGRMQQPDGMTINPKTKTVFVNFPNFNYRKDDSGPKNYPGILARLKITGDTATAEELLEYEKAAPFPETGQVGPMGMFFGPDGHLYVCDNQYFFNKNHKSRMLRVLMDGDNPTGKVEVVVEGTKLSNAALWVGDRMFVTDTFMDIEGQPQAGCVWMFTLEELSKAGKDGNPPVKVKPLTKMEDDPHCISLSFVKELPGCGNAGADGLTADKDGNVYYGNFGNGEVYQIVFDADGKAKTNIIHEAGEYFGCCDGIFYYAETNEIYVNDSAANAIHAFTPPAPGAKAVFRTLWENGDTDGADGSLDQPAELVVVDGKMIIANFDWAFPELLNTQTGPPNTLSVINLK
jgi:sugar lactone lactonase YvrE